MIQDVQLNDLVAEVELADKERRVQAAKVAIEHVLRSISTHDANVRKLVEQTSAEQKKLDAAKARYERINQGDWNVLPSEDEQKKVKEQ